MSRQKDSVVNFLTPTKLITGFKPKLKANGSDNLPKPPASTTLRGNHSVFNYDADHRIKQQQVLEGGIDKWDQTQSYKSQLNFVHNKSKTPSEDRLNLNIRQELNKSNLYEKKLEDSRNFDFSKINELQGSQRQQVYNKLKVSQQKQQAFPSGKQKQMFELIRKLKTVKQLIDDELAQLQFLLDDASKYIGDIDEQYHKIKQEILDYTSRVLDASFRQYRANIINLQSFKNIRRDAKLLVNQVEEFIFEQEQQVQQAIIRKEFTQEKYYDKQSLINKNINDFKVSAEQLQIARKQCLRMKPTLKKDKIIEFQNAIKKLSNFQRAEI